MRVGIAVSTSLTYISYCAVFDLFYVLILRVWYLMHDGILKLSSLHTARTRRLATHARCLRYARPALTS